MLQKQAKSRKEQIALTAIDIISEGGTQNLSMLKIAKRIGVTDAALYKHFKSKNEMLLFMVDKIEEMLIDRMKEHSKNFKDPLDKLRNILGFQFSFIEENKGIPRILFSEALQFKDKNLTSKITNILNQYLKLLKSTITDAKKVGSIKSSIDSDTLAVIFMGMIQSTVILWTLSGCKFSLKEREKSLWKGFKLLVR
ncbi:MAG: TetR/AcrR family transcriptional regulator [Melioribacteraceae bacterium]|nr:TetR/AcrR family transcriptional regulator [Melioribacteraceae bacterium]